MLKFRVDRRINGNVVVPYETPIIADEDAPIDVT